MKIGMKDLKSTDSFIKKKGNQCLVCLRVSHITTNIVIILLNIIWTFGELRV